jgi:hypothetical protein
MKRKNRISKILRVAGVLLCLVMVTSYFSSGMLARYVTRANGDDTARIAALKVSAETVEKTDAATAFTRTYEVTLKNDSDVAVRYEASPVLELPKGAKGDAAITGDEVDNGVFSGSLAPHTEEKVTLTLDLTGLELGADAFATFDNNDISGWAGELSFTVTVVFTQID